MTFDTQQYLQQPEGDQENQLINAIKKQLFASTPFNGVDKIIPSGNQLSRDFLNADKRNQQVNALEGTGTTAGESLLNRALAANNVSDIYSVTNQGKKPTYTGNTNEPLDQSGQKNIQKQGDAFDSYMYGTIFSPREKKPNEIYGMDYARR